jgi:hypothetical protein
MDDPPLSETVLLGLLDAASAEVALPPEVTDSLEQARRACGPSDGAFEITPSQNGRPRSPVRFDHDSIERLARPATPPAAVAVDHVSGRLIRLDEQPERVVIRAADGVEWTCEYDEAIADELGQLWRKTVWAAGEGTLQSATKGRMRVHHVAAVITGEAQETLFAPVPVATVDLLASGPQGLDALADDDDSYDEAEERYLEAILSDA